MDIGITRYNQDVAILLENFDDEMIYEFIYTLEHNIIVFPWPNRFHCSITDDYYDEYQKSIKSRIPSCSVIIAFVTNKFCHNKECIEWIEYSKELEKPLTALIVEKIENYEDIKD